MSDAGSAVNEFNAFKVKQERMDAVDLTGVGAMAGSGDMPRTKFNNPYAGHAIISIPDVMAAPDTITYRKAWLAAKTQHPLISLIADGDEGVPPALPVQFTITKIELYGASAGIITMLPFVQRPTSSFNYHIPGGNAVFRPIGQQLIDVGTISRKPVLSHSFGDSIDNTRNVNIGPFAPTAGALNFADDQLCAYQYIQKATTPVPVDSGYLRISFICRITKAVPLNTAFPLNSDLQNASSSEDLDKKSLKRTAEQSQIVKIKRVKDLTLPTLDQH